LSTEDLSVIDFSFSVYLEAWFKSSFAFTVWKIIESVCMRVVRNPVGRTGICGRGLLGRWGPNQGGDPVVTR